MLLRYWRIAVSDIANCSMVCCPVLPERGVGAVVGVVGAIPPVPAIEIVKKSLPRFLLRSYAGIQFSHASYRRIAEDSQRLHPPVAC